MSTTRSGMCLGDDLPQLHRLCRGRFTANAGEMEHSFETDCSCDCHKPDTALHRQVRRVAQVGASSQQANNFSAADPLGRRTG